MADQAADTDLVSDYEALSLFLAKYSVLNLLLACMQFRIQEYYIHTSRHRKATIRSKWTFFCVCPYECNDPEWGTAYKQSTKTGLIQNISQGREKESFIMFSFWGNGFPSKIRSFARWQECILAQLRRNVLEISEVSFLLSHASLHMLDFVYF